MVAETRVWSRDGSPLLSARADYVNYKGVTLHSRPVTVRATKTLWVVVEALQAPHLVGRRFSRPDGFAYPRDLLAMSHYRLTLEPVP